jgi:hypothetical protein
VALNATFVAFLLYRGLVVQEMMQFVAFYSGEDSPYLRWEAWRRDPQASVATKVRWINFAFISAVPLLVSILLTFVTARLAWTDRPGLAGWIEAATVLPVHSGPDSFPGDRDGAAGVDAGGRSSLAPVGTANGVAASTSRPALAGRPITAASAVLSPTQRRLALADTLAGRALANMRLVRPTWWLVVLWELIAIVPLLVATLWTATARWHEVEHGTISVRQWGSANPHPWPFWHWRRWVPDPRKRQHAERE